MSMSMPPDPEAVATPGYPIPTAMLDRGAPFGLFDAFSRLFSCPDDEGTRLGKTD